nr:retrovirus-related Pol polyprotein from transposon TNT 1-94 [Tanacetum cinerariifolium]
MEMGLGSVGFCRLEEGKQASYSLLVSNKPNRSLENLESPSSQPQDACKTDAPKSSGNSNPTTTLTNPPADQLETLTVETPIPTVSLPVPTVCFTDSQEPSKESNGVEADVSNMETTITASPTPTLRIHMDHPKKPKKISDALQDPSWVEAMQEELLQFKIQKVWSLVDFPKGVRPIGTKWVLKNKKDERGIVIRDKARLVAQGHTQEEGIDYDEVFAPVARIKAIRLFLAYASFMGFTVYQMDVKSAFLYGTIDEEVYVMQPPRFQDPEYQVTPKECHLHAVKRIFRYLKGHPKLGLWYPKDSPFDLTIVATSTTEAEYVAAASCCGQVLQIQNQLLDYGDFFEKKLINVDHIHTYENVADLLTKPFDAGRFQYLVDQNNKRGTQILATVDGVLRTVTKSSLRRNLKLQDEEGISYLLDTELFGEGSGTPTEPHHTPSHEAQPSLHTHISSPSIPTVTFVPTIPIPTVIPSETTLIRQYTRRARIAQSFAFPPVADEPASPVRDDSQGEACPTDSGFIADQDRATIAKSSTLPHDSAPRVTSHAAKEGTQEVEINRLKERVKVLEDKERVIGARSRDDAPIKGRRIDEEDVATERLSIPTGSDVVPTASPVFATATVVTPYRRKKGKEVIVESETPKKQKLQEQIDAQIARELKEQLESEDQRRSEQIAIDEEITRIHAEEELQIMIDGLDRSNEVISKHLAEYDQAAADLTIRERIELIMELVKYQDHHSKILQYQAQQKKPKTKKKKKDFYMAVIKNNLGWKAKDFKGMSFEEVEAKFKTESAKKQKISKEVPEEVKSFDEVPEEKIKEMMQLVPIEEVYMEALQVKHPIIDWKVHIEGQRAYWKITRLGGSSASYQFFTDLLKHLDRDDLNQLWSLVKETLSKRPTTSEKDMELWVELSRLYKPNVEDKLWTHTQNFMHAPAEWKLYEKYEVHQLTSKDKNIFMLLEKDYPLRKGLALVMICYKLQVENYSQMADDLVRKIYNIENSPR